MVNHPLKYKIKYQFGMFSAVFFLQQHSHFVIINEH